MSDTELLQHSKLNLYRVVDYDSKWSTKFHKDCMFGQLFYFSFNASFANSFNFQNSIRANVGHRAFATLKLNCIV